MSVLPSTLTRLERVLTMVPWLLKHPGTRVDELARRFQARPDAILEDLDILGYCGIPGYGGGDLVEVRILGDRVSVHLADFFRRPLRLTVRQALALLLAGEALASLPALADQEPLARAVDKVRALLDPTASASSRRPGVTVDLQTAGDEHLPALRDAVDRRVVVRLLHRSRATGQMRERVVEPWSLVASAGAWYLQGWDREAGAQRDFRLDRVREVVVSAERATLAVPDPVPPPRYEPGADDPTVVLEVAPAAGWLAEQLVVDANEDRGAVQRLTFRTPALGWLARLVLALGPDVRVVAPKELDDAVVELAGRTLDRYRPSD